MIPTPSSDAPLSPDWAFVVQLRQGTAFTPEALHGRVEHIVTGQATTFVSLAALVAFIKRVLKAPGDGPTTHGPQGSPLRK